MAFVKTEVQGAVEIITIDRPKALNALNPEVLADLKAAFEAVDQATIRCIVLTGEGDKSFVAGADIGSMSTMTKAEGEAFGKLGNDVFLMIEHFPIPVIAAVNGFALGGGNELGITGSDLVLAAIGPLLLDVTQSNGVALNLCKCLCNALAHSASANNAYLHSKYLQILLLRGCRGGCSHPPAGRRGAAPTRL